MVEITVLVNVSIKLNYVYSHSLITGTYYVMEFRAGIWFDGFRMLIKWECFYYYCKSNQCLLVISTDSLAKPLIK